MQKIFALFAAFFMLIGGVLMPNIYWRESNPAATTVSTADDLLNQVETSPNNVALPGLVMHPLNSKLYGGLPSGSSVPIAPLSWPEDYLYPPIYAPGSSTKAAFQRKGTWVSANTFLRQVLADGATTAQNSLFTITKAQLGNRDYVLVFLVGQGGGSTTGYTLPGDRAGGGSGARTVALVKVPANGLQVRVSGHDNGGTGTLGGPGGDGMDTILYKYGSATTPGAELAYARGGKGGTRGSGGAGGTMSALVSGSDVKVISSVGGKTGPTNSGYVTPNDCPYTLPGRATADWDWRIATAGWGGNIPGYGGNNGNKGLGGNVSFYY